jgi:IclR family acetate operon transcriptional repressor
MKVDFKIPPDDKIALAVAVPESGELDRPYEVRSLSRAVAILDAFGDEETLSLLALGKRLDLPKPTLFRLTSALEGEGLLERSGQGDFRLGSRLVSLARRALSGGLVPTARGILQELFESFGHTVNLGVLSGGEVLFLDVCESRHRLRMVCEVGSREPIHATAIGKAMAAACNPERLAAILRDRPLHAVTRRTITSRAQFDIEMEATRARGYAVDLGECQESAHCVAAAVTDGSGLIAGISVSAIANQLPEDDISIVGAAVSQAAYKLAEKLGRRPGQPDSLKARPLDSFDKRSQS